MEAATLSTPQRKFDAVPAVQKSLSLPSYAKAGGEGIDHRIIFAALEQREKVRRKSKIFTREKTARQNIFCLPIPSSGAKCRETSFSSDTSCSSLEYQKPKTPSKTKKGEIPNNQEITKSSKNEPQATKTNHLEIKPNPNFKDANDHRKEDIFQETQKIPLKTDSFKKGQKSPQESLLRPNVHSSDSMERSSRSSNDSLSRKERLEAIKAKVEAAREKYGHSSSEEEEDRHVITRYNSDGVIHRSVKEVKSRSYRLEKRLRRRSQDDYNIRKALRQRNNLSLCLNSTEEGIKLDLFNRSFNIFDDHQSKTDFCPSPNFLDFTKKSYFSDFPSKEIMARNVQARVKQIEEEEKRRRNSVEKNATPTRQSPQSTSNSSPYSTHKQNLPFGDNLNHNANSEKMAYPDTTQCTSPIGRAPTPPPRSPKSMSFVTKTLLQHQNMQLNLDSRSLERKQIYKPNIPLSKPVVNSKIEMSPSDTKVTKLATDEFSERRRIKELFSARRKTCSHFDFSNESMLRDFNLRTDTSSLSKSHTNGTNSSLSQLSPSSPSTNKCASKPTSPLYDPKMGMWKSKWEETEKKQEFVFNSLESKKCLSPFRVKSPETSKKSDVCLCYVISGDRSKCTCNQNSKKVLPNLSPRSKLRNISNQSNSDGRHIKSRLCKSDMNIDVSAFGKSKIQSCNESNLNMGTKHEMENGNLSATANLDSAMEELESVYRSLKLSSDIFADNDSDSRLKLNDLNVGTSNAYSSDISDTHVKPHMKKSNVNSCERKIYNIKPIFDNSPKCTATSVSSLQKDISPNAPEKTLESDSICIDELFNDLTRQLDIEQKLITQFKDSPNGNRAPHMHKNFIDQRRPTPLESIVSIRKELYNNLKKSSQEQVKQLSPSMSQPTFAQKLQQEASRKKYKAVRSLSENISQLMAHENSSPVLERKPITGQSICSKLETCVVGRSSPKHYEHVALEQPKVLTKKETSVFQPAVPKRSFISDKLKKYNTEEIRQIRVSMDSDVSDNKPIVSQTPFSEHPRLSSAVTRPHMSPKSDARRANAVHKEQNNEIFDETGLENLLNTLLGDIPNSQQSSLLLSNDNLTSTPPPTPTVTSAGKCFHAKYTKNFLPFKMDSCAKGGTETCDQECRQRLKSEELAQAANAADCHHYNATNPMSFIPVYANKAVCHKFKSAQVQSEIPSERKVLKTYSPPTKPRVLPGSGNEAESRFSRSHIRRRSIGFEDITSLCYGHNMSNDRRFQSSINNSNILQSPTEQNCSVYLNSGIMGKSHQSENSHFSSLNYNSQLSSGENANDSLQQHQTNKPMQRYKDKSSKRKSSLNRIDFINFSATGNNVDAPQQKNSSSDEGGENKPFVKKSESPIGTAKRKHNVDGTNNAACRPEGKTNEVSVSNSSLSKGKSNLLPRSSPGSSRNSRPFHWRQSANIRFSQKLSHSAGEIESLTDLSEVPSKSKTYLSAQECDETDILHKSKLQGVKARNPKLSLSSAKSTKSKSCDTASQDVAKNDGEQHKDVLVVENVCLAADNTMLHSDQNEGAVRFEQKNTSVILNCDDVNNPDVLDSSIQLENLEITDDCQQRDIYLSADENGEIDGSDGERRPSSILRKKSSDDKRELHSILKLPADEKLSKTRPSILKHRDSSEEKETWQPNDLISILKKTTSEEDSCNSGPDIRPILKFSTDDESSSGGGLRPRPILKKRTSFSDECSYVSFPSGDLKPILKKKSTLSSDDQPRPILKSRRKSEDTRSTLSEVITSRPRAYSADMGVKKNFEGAQPAEDLEIKNEFSKHTDSHNLL